MKLSPRQLQICRLSFVDGLPDKEIARRLWVSHRTVEDHRQEVYRRIGSNRALRVLKVLFQLQPDLGCPCCGHREEVEE